jgi:hypothetical protein
MKGLFSSYRNRTIFSVIGMVIVLLFVYQNNISKTIHLYREFNQMSAKLNQNADLELQVTILQKRLRELDKGTFATNTVDSLPQSAMLDIISRVCAQYSLKLYKLGDPILYNQQQYRIELNMITLEGSFMNLTKAIYDLENANTLKANLMSVEYKLVKRYAGKGDRLTATLYLQRVKGGILNEK